MQLHPHHTRDNLLPANIASTPIPRDLKNNRALPVVKIALYWQWISLALDLNCQFVLLAHRISKAYWVVWFALHNLYYIIFTDRKCSVRTTGAPGYPSPAERSSPTSCSSSQQSLSDHDMKELESLHCYKAAKEGMHSRLFIMTTYHFLPSGNCPGVDYTYPEAKRWSWWLSGEGRV